MIGTLQPIVSRKVTAVRYVPAEPGQNPETVVFDTRLEFQGGTYGGETVAVALQGGAWRVWDYAVSPSTEFLARYSPFYSRHWVSAPSRGPAAQPDNRIVNRVNPRPKEPFFR